MDQHQKKKAQFSGAYLLLAFAALLFVQGVIAKRAAPKAVPRWTASRAPRAS